MITYEQAVEQKRSKLVGIVDVLASAHGSKMRAYQTVGQEIARSPTWVRRVIGRSPLVRIDLHDALNIAALYDRLCARIEAAAEHEEARADVLRSIRHAVVEGGRPARDGVDGPARRGAARAGGSAARVAAAALDAQEAMDAYGSTAAARVTRG
ncbi:hypothetical protein [Methylobacterium isbiliense]|uniref:Uncharacterized protein n=1 Tax=Methylobacterium isbiliense TaxID=315478 RepID=A0ABQ4SDK9_9HYPH|nr:hypothetical protein [Methylobacterium isbiliense]MDN3622572.1 hypothetical protein [Methylobacterium isbiliense]GJE00580.1 hypothetical protein GMJLKIPL_2503 [Methylobacterium isbiliense]